MQGRRLLGFTTSPDGARHTYWFDFTNRHNLKYKHTGEKSWFGMVHALTVEQVLSGTKLPVENLRLTFAVLVRQEGEPSSLLQTVRGLEPGRQSWQGVPFGSQPIANG